MAVYTADNPGVNAADGADGRTVTEMMGANDAGWFRRQKRVNKGISAMQDARGDHRGTRPFGYAFRPRTKRSPEPVIIEVVDPQAIAHVVDTYRRDGTFLGTARALNAEGFPSARGRTWHATTVKSVILREAPELATNVRQGTRRERRPRLLTGLLRCYCGGPMSPTTGGGAPGWYCGRAQRGLHGRPSYISESKLMSWIKDEAAKLRTEVDEVGLPLEGQDDSAERQAIAVLRAAGHDVSALEAALAAKADALEARRAQWEALPPAVDWQDWTVEEINRALRALWHHVRLGPDLMPVAASRRVPEWWTDQNIW